MVLDEPAAMAMLLFESDREKSPVAWAAAPPSDKPTIDATKKMASMDNANRP